MKKLFLVLLTPFVLNAQLEDGFNKIKYIRDAPWFKIVCDMSYAGWKDTTMTYTNLEGHPSIGNMEFSTLSACLSGQVNNCGYWDGGMISNNEFQFFINPNSETRINLTTKVVTSINYGESSTQQCQGYIY